jgi:hypothetical protein
MLGFNPAAPSNTPGIVTLCDNFIPYDSGMEASPSATDVGASALAAVCTGAFSGSKLDGTTRVFAGTGTKLYELSGTSWTDRSVGGGSYTSGSEWMFCQFGDITLASNGIETIQASSATAFVALTAPKAVIIDSVVTGAGGFVFAANTDTATDQVQWSALNDHTDWSDSVSTQSGSARLLGAGGAITAGKAFGADSIVFYKANVGFHARYVGGSAIWQFSEIPELGCVGKRAVTNIDGMAHFAVGADGFWLYDGARPQKIGQEVREWFTSNLDYSYADDTEVRYDQGAQRVYVFFRKTGSSSVNTCLVWHVPTNRWGVMTQPLETTLRYISPGQTFDGLSGTFDTWPGGSFDAAPTARKLLAVFNTSHKLCTLTGQPGTSWFQTADMGDHTRASRLTEANVVYQLRPASASCSAYASSMLGGTELVGPTVTAHDEPGSSNTPGRVTLRQHARFHRLEWTFTGPVRVTDYGAKITPAGSR